MTDDNQKKTKGYRLEDGTCVYIGSEGFYVEYPNGIECFKTKERVFVDGDKFRYEKNYKSNEEKIILGKPSFADITIQKNGDYEYTFKNNKLSYCKRENRAKVEFVLGEKKYEAVIEGHKIGKITCNGKEISGDARKKIINESKKIMQNIIKLSNASLQLARSTRKKANEITQKSIKLVKQVQEKERKEEKENENENVKAEQKGKMSASQRKKTSSSKDSNHKPSEEPKQNADSNPMVVQEDEEKDRAARDQEIEKERQRRQKEADERALYLAQQKKKEGDRMQANAIILGIDQHLDQTCNAQEKNAFYYFARQSAQLAEGEQAKALNRPLTEVEKAEILKAEINKLEQIGKDKVVNAYKEIEKQIKKEQKEALKAQEKVARTQEKMAVKRAKESLKTERKAQKAARKEEKMAQKAARRAENTYDGR